MDNLTVAHRFFYSDFNSYCSYSGMSVSYQDNVFYSYYTVIGAVVKNKNNENVCLISSNNMSSTTSKHIGCLKSACPFNYYLVPFEYGNHYFSFNNIIDRLISNIEYYSESKLTQKANRIGFNENYETLKELLNNFELEELTTAKAQQTLKDFENQYNILNDSESLKELKEKQRKLDSERIKKAKAELKALKEKYSYMELISMAYNPYNNEYLHSLEYSKAKELVTKLRKTLNNKNDLAFIWFDGDSVKTSKNITVDKKETVALLRLWQHNKLKHGMKISYYTVLSVTDDFVTVGCHKIPVENLKELVAELDSESKKQVA